MKFTTEQISFIKQLITNRNKEVRHEVSDHLDNTLPLKKLKGGNRGEIATTDENGNALWVPRFGGRMYLVSSFNLASQTLKQLGNDGVSGDYWALESDTSPDSNFVDHSSNPRFYIPYSGYYSGRLVAYYGPASVVTSIAAYLSLSPSSNSFANCLGTGHANQQSTSYFGTSCHAAFNHIYLSAGQYVYPLLYWQYSGAAGTGSHQVLGTTGTGVDTTYMELRYHGPS